MSNKTRVCLAVAALIAAAAVPASLLPADSPAGASTTGCGSACTSPTVQSVGTGEALAVSGSSVVMSAANTTSSTEDWTPESEGTVTNAVDAGVVSARLAMSYGGDTMVEFQYAPNGFPSDQCLSDTAAVPFGGPNFYDPTLTVALTQCGITAQSLWILDGNGVNGYVDLINAGYEVTSAYGVPENTQTSTANNLTNPFAEPAVLTVNSSGKVVLAPLSEIGGVVSPTQMWADWSAPAQSALRAKVAKSR